MMSAGELHIWPATCPTAAACTEEFCGPGCKCPPCSCKLCQARSLFARFGGRTRPALSLTTAQLFPTDDPTPGEST